MPSLIVWYANHIGPITGTIMLITAIVTACINRRAKRETTLPDLLLRTVGVAVFPASLLVALSVYYPSLKEKLTDSTINTVVLSIVLFYVAWITTFAKPNEPGIKS
jgi:tellurite resistance protein TehA-like permease